MGGVAAGRVRDVVFLSHHMFCLADDGDFPRDYRPPRDGLTAVHPGAVVVFTGIHTGTVGVTAEVRAAQPEDVSVDVWEEVVEVSFESVLGRARIVGLMAYGRDQHPRLPLLTPAGPGPYRVRVHARGRDTAPDGVAAEPFEEYLVVVWPGPAAPEVVYKQSDRYGETRRRSAAMRPDLISAPPRPEDRQPSVEAEALRRVARRYGLLDQE